VILVEVETTVLMDPRVVALGSPMLRKPASPSRLITRLVVTFSVLFSALFSALGVACGGLVDDSGGSDAGANGDARHGGDVVDAGHAADGGRAADAPGAVDAGDAGDAYDAPLGLYDGGDYRLYGVWGSAKDDVWAVGGGSGFCNSSYSIIEHWDGKAWAFVPVPLTSGTLSGVWGSGPNDVWAVGAEGGTLDAFGEILHWAGTVWSAIPTPYPNGILTSVWGSGPKDAWAVGYTTLAPYAEGAPGEERGVILHWDGKLWTVAASPPTSVLSLYGVWGGGPRDVWAVGGGASACSAEGCTFESTVLHWDGSEWSASAVPSTGGSGPDGGAIVPIFSGVGGTGANDVWAVGSTSIGETCAIDHWNGVAWSFSSCTSANALSGVWSSSSNDVWAGGEFGIFEHWDGTAWSSSPTPVPTQFVDGLWGSASNDIWAVGWDMTSSLGVILHWDGGTW
jgi:hypothetical protein